MNILSALRGMVEIASRPTVAELLDGHPDADDPKLIELAEEVVDGAKPGAPLDELQAFIRQTWALYVMQRDRGRDLVLDERLRFATVICSPVGWVNLKDALFLLCKSDLPAAEIIRALEQKAASELTGKPS